MLKKSVFVIVLFYIISIRLIAQSQSFVANPQAGKDRFSVGASVGSMGLSVDASVHICDWARVRAGVSYMPELTTSLRFNVQVGDDTENKDDENGLTKFDKMANLLNQLTGYDVDDHVDMDCKASFVNARLFVDFMPFPNKDWHFTAGVFLGSETVGRACNSIEDMTTTLAVGIYNTMYDKLENDEPLFTYNDVNISLSPEQIETIMRYGRMGIHLGNFKKDGSAYMMEPASDGTVRVKAKVKKLKPYAGFGWDHKMKRAPEWRYGFDAGVVFWGGVPNVTTHDGTSLTEDVRHLKGRVNDVITNVKSFPVYPLLELKISRTIF